MNTIQFDQMPELCLRKIFAFLGLRDLVKCRAVSRQFKHYADQTKATELIVGRTKGYLRSRHWFGTDREIDFENSISLNAFRSAKTPPFELNQQLKFLFIFAVNNQSYKILSCLKQLIHLEVVEWNLLLVTTLALSNLRTLVIFNNWALLVILETPKLESLRCEIDKVRIDYPDTIKQLGCSIRKNYKHLAKFKNMKVLHVDLNAGCFPNEILLLNLVGLKELHFAINICDAFMGRSCCEELQSSLANLLRERSILKRDKLKVYLNEVLLVDVKQVPAFEILFDSKRTDHDQKVEDGFKFMNYRLLLRHSYPTVTSVDFNRLMKLDFEISEDFFSRFPQIQEITAKDSVDPEQFEWFLQNATALRSLSLIDTRLDQAFFDRLPERCSRLTCLKVNDCFGLINFQFLLRIKQLESFETNRQLSLLDLTAFRQLAKLESICFKIGNSSVEINRFIHPTEHYSLHILDDLTDVRDFRRFRPTKTFDREDLDWAQLTALYEQIRAGLLDPPEKRMRVKRARLE